MQAGESSRSSFDCAQVLVTSLMRILLHVWSLYFVPRLVKSSKRACIKSVYTLLSKGIHLLPSRSKLSHLELVNLVLVVSQLLQVPSQLSLILRANLPTGD